MANQSLPYRIKGENPFMCMCSVCVTYTVCKYATLRTALKVFAVVQWRRQVNLIIFKWYNNKFEPATAVRE